MRGLVVTGARALGCVSVGVLQIAAQGIAPARAADQRDLDERIAEFEQTAARTGSRQLQFNMYGQIDRALLFWNDGFDSGTYGVDNHTSSSRFGFVGQAANARGSASLIHDATGLYLSAASGWRNAAHEVPIDGEGRFW